MFLLNKFLVFLIPLVSGQYFKDQEISNATGSRTGEYINIEKYPYIVSIRFAKSRKVICTGILVTFSWVLSVPYCFMLTPEHYKRTQDSKGAIPPDIEAWSKKKSKSISRRLALERKYDNYKRSRKRTHQNGSLPFNDALPTSTTEAPLTEEQMKKSVIHLEPKTFKIIAGATSLRAEGQVRTGERIVIHPDFKLSKKKKGSPAHELALLKTDMPYIEQNNVQKAPVLETFLFEKNPSRNCKLVGWGRGKTIKPLPHLKTTISEISVQLFNPSKCRFIAKTQQGEVRDDDEDPGFCSYDEKNNAIPVCQSDSGGPLVCDDKVVGLMSWLRSPLCYYNITEYIYTRPIYYCTIYTDLVWVREVLGESSTRMSIQIEDDSNTSQSLGASRSFVMAITAVITLFFIDS